MEPPLVSVIVPTKDRPDLLRRALDSIAAQDFAHGIEVVVVDDGSADPQEWVTQLDLGLDVTLVRHERSRDLAGARNAGLRVARGTYVGYLDDDDVWLPHHARLLVDALRTSGLRAAYSIAERWSQELDTGGTWRTVETTVEHRFAQFDPRILQLTNLTPVNAVLHERSLVDEIGGFDEVLPVVEDWDMWIRMREVTDFAHVPEVTCAYTTRPAGNMTQERILLFWPAQARVFDRYAHVAARYPGIAERQRTHLDDVLHKHPPHVQQALRAKAQALLARPADDSTLHAAPTLPRVSVVVPVADDAAATLATVQALAAHTPEEDVEFVFVDDCADLASRQLLATLEGDVRVVRHDARRGVAASHATGHAAAAGEHVVLLAPDQIVGPGWLDVELDAA